MCLGRHLAAFRIVFPLSARELRAWFMQHCLEPAPGGGKSYFSIIPTISRSLSRAEMDLKMFTICTRCLSRRSLCGYKCLLFELPCKYWICFNTIIMHTFLCSLLRFAHSPASACLRQNRVNKKKNVFQGEGFQLSRDCRRSAFSNGDGFIILSYFWSHLTMERSVTKRHNR